MKTWWRRLSRRWGILRRLRGAGDWWLFLRALGFAAVVPLLMRLPLPRLGTWLERRIASHPAPVATSDGHDQIIRVVRGAIAFGSPLISGRCLTRGLTLFYFLRRAGVDLVLEFGVKLGQPEFSGHCWLVKDEQPFLERGDPRRNFITMYRLPQRPVEATA